jgi:hypothetical protein
LARAEAVPLTIPLSMPAAILEPSLPVMTASVITPTDCSPSIIFFQSEATSSATSAVSAPACC